MEWVIRFIAIWTIFILLANWKEIKTNVWCGIFAVGLQLAVDTFFIKNNLYNIPDPIISLWGNSLFFVLGPAFVVGMLFSQFHPHKRWLQILYVIVFSAVYDLEEFLLLVRKALIYENWSFISSVVFNLMIMMCLSWFSVVVLKRGVKKN